MLETKLAFMKNRDKPNCNFTILRIDPNELTKKCLVDLNIQKRATLKHDKANKSKVQITFKDDTDLNKAANKRQKPVTIKPLRLNQEYLLASDPRD